MAYLLKTFTIPHCLGNFKYSWKKSSLQNRVKRKVENKMKKHARKIEYGVFDKSSGGKINEIEKPG